MTWWVPMPDAMNRDPRVRVISRGARGVLSQLIIESKGANEVPYVNHHDGPSTIGVIAWCEGDPAPALAVAREVQEMLDTGLLSFDDEARRIRLHLTERLPANGAVAARDVAAPIARRVKPSDDRARTAMRNARHYFSKRERSWAAVPAELTWNDWLATEAGQAWCLARHIDPADAATPRNAPATPCNALRATPRNAPATPPPPHSPSPEKDREKETDPPDPQRPATRCAQRPDATPPQRVAGALQGVAEARVSTVESVGLAAAEVVAVLRARCPRKLFLAEDSRTLAELQRVVTDISARGRWALPDYETLGDWIAADGLGWWSQGKPGLAYLLRPGMLATHLEEAREWVEAGRPRIVHRGADTGRGAPTRRRAGPSPVSTAEEFDEDGPDPLLAIARGP